MKQQKNTQEKYKFKLVVLGQAAVGKSSLVLRFAQNEFTDNYIPTLQDTFRKNIFIDNNMVQLEILDTAGQEDYSSLLDFWIQEGHGFLLCYSTTALDSFNELERLKQQISAVRTDQPKILIVGTKADLVNERKVDFELAKKYAQENSFEAIETSAKTGLNCNESFNQIVNLLIQQLKSKKKTDSKEQKQKLSFFEKYCSLI